MMTKLRSIARELRNPDREAIRKTVRSKFLWAWVVVVACYDALVMFAPGGEEYAGQAVIYTAFVLVAAIFVYTWNRDELRWDRKRAEDWQKHEEELQRRAYERAVADEQHDRELEIVRAGGPEAEEIRARWEAERIAAEEARRRQNQEIIAAYEAKQLDKLDKLDKLDEKIR